MVVVPRQPFTPALAVVGRLAAALVVGDPQPSARSRVIAA
jgi:hypothetical protein